MKEFFSPADYTGSDVERINKALADAAEVNGTVRICPRLPDPAAARDHWLLDSAILLPGNCSLILDNCRIKLSDTCRDNMIRSANCSMGCGDIDKIRNVHITGIGKAVLEGADDPRSTGDSGKTLGKHTYGSDCGRENESQYGDWRNIGILLVKVDDFSIRNITVRNSHAWAISLEYCTNGNISDLKFDSLGKMFINGRWETTLNQDGLDLRRGCRNISITDISGATGDDLIALTAIGARNGRRPAGIVKTTEMSGPSEDPADEDVYNISIQNVVGRSAGGHHIVRFLNNFSVNMHNVTLDGLIDTSLPEKRNFAAVRIGDTNPAWGGVNKLGTTSAFIVTNIHSKAKNPILIAGSLCDSIISNVINCNPDVEAVVFQSGQENVRNVIVTDVMTLK